MHPLIQEIQAARSVVLSTHTQPDGDGIGSQVALYWALRKIGKNVRIINVDAIPKKYVFLNTHQIIESFDNLKSPIEKADLGFIFDTNDPKLLLNLWPQLKSQCRRVVFVDHHPILDRHPLKSDENIIDVEASSTGQIVFDLIKSLQIPLDAQIALPIYTSIIFDTNYFRYVRGSPTPHLIAAELLRYDIDPLNVHRRLFGNHTPNKLKFLSQILGTVEYEMAGRLGLVRVKKADMANLGIEMDETRDIIDMVMNVETIEAAVLFREDDKDQFKISFRSKGILTVNGLAQSLGGGGHQFASGTTLKGPFAEVRKNVLNAFATLFDALDRKAVSG